MENKEKNREIVENYATKEYWKPDYAAFFSADIVQELPSAPPGMPQYMDAFEFRLYRSWLSRTVTGYQAQLRALYGTADPNVFWLIRDVYADVRWCKEPGKFNTRIFSRVNVTNGKISYIKSNWNPLSFLYAVHVNVPTFRMDLYHPRVEDYLKKAVSPGGARDPEPKLDMSGEAVAKRIQNNLDAFRCGDYFDALEHMATFSPNHESKVWFLPPEMKENYPKDLMKRVEAWTTLSCPKIDFDESGRYWATDDPHVYFAEYMCWGEVDWIGNHAAGSHYRNRYFYILRFDKAGRIACCEEILNPINKLNSIGVSIPSFPYYV